MSFIIPTPLLTNLFSRKLRLFLKNNYSIKQILNFEYEVFDDPTIHTCIIVLANIISIDNEVFIKKEIDNPDSIGSQFDFSISQRELGNNKNASFDIFFDTNIAGLLLRLNSISQPLDEICYIRQCIKTGDDKIYVQSSENQLEHPWKPTLKGRSINRYAVIEKNLFIKYGDWLARNWKNTSFYERPKIVVRETGNQIIAALDVENRYVLSSLYAVYPRERFPNLNLKYLLGILNSRFATFYIHLIAYSLTKGAFTKIRTNQLGRLPIILYTLKDSDESEKLIIKNVETIIELKNRQATINLSNEIQQLQRAIDHAERRIDKMVYELYGLTEEEVAIVEGRE